MNKTLLLVIIIILLSLAILAELIGIRWKEVSAYKSCQPESIIYDSFNYCVEIIKAQHTLDIDCEIRVWDEDKGAYFSVNYSNEGKYANFKDTKTTWSVEGVTILIRQGESMFFAKERFIGGR